MDYARTDAGHIPPERLQYNGTQFRDDTRPAVGRRSRLHILRVGVQLTDSDRVRASADIAPPQKSTVSTGPRTNGRHVLVSLMSLSLFCTGSNARTFAAANPLDF